MISLLFRVTTKVLFLFFWIARFGKCNKQLVLFAGPHQSASTSVEKFYHNFASGYNHAKTAKGLDGWVWPSVYGNLNQDHDILRHKIWSYLVTHANNTEIQETLHKAILDGWRNAQEGVILGTEEFDRIGLNPDTYYNGLEAMMEIVNNLQVASPDVWVVLNYRAPRVEQWESVWKHNSDTDYKEYLCQNPNSVWESLDTAMNPLKLAKKIRELTGWNVLLIDMVGVAKYGTDVSHVIACDILGNTQCKDGWVWDRYNRTYHENSIVKDLNDIKTEQKKELEILFRQRDCHYKKDLENDSQFHALHESTLWQGCEPNHSDIYEQLADTDVFAALVQSQLGCWETQNKIEDFLVGDYDKLTYAKPLDMVMTYDETQDFQDLKEVEYEEDEAATEEAEKHSIRNRNEKHSRVGPFIFVFLFALGLLYTRKQKQNERRHLWKSSMESGRNFDEVDAEYGIGYSDNIDDQYDDESEEGQEVEIPEWRHDDNLDNDAAQRTTDKLLMRMPRRKTSATSENVSYGQEFDLKWALGTDDLDDSSDDDCDEQEDFADE